MNALECMKKRAENRRVRETLKWLDCFVDMHVEAMMDFSIGFTTIGFVQTNRCNFYVFYEKP